MTSNSTHQSRGGNANRTSQNSNQSSRNTHATGQHRSANRGDRTTSALGGQRQSRRTYGNHSHRNGQHSATGTGTAAHNGQQPRAYSTSKSAKITKPRQSGTRNSHSRNKMAHRRMNNQPIRPVEEVKVLPPKYRKGTMRIVPLGGLGEIGRNMNVIEYNGRILLIDCGVLFPEEEQPGVDLILPDFSYIKDRLDKVDGLVLTHGHEDHIGAVPYLLRLRKDIPLIGSKLTLAFVDSKCKEHNLQPTLVEVQGRDELKVGEFELEFIAVTHSIPDALAVQVKTPAGTIIDTGDMKLDQLPLDHRITDLREFARLGEQGVDLLMSDSTNAEVPGFVKPEVSITPALDRAFSEASRKIIVASFSSHVHRVQQVVDVAHKYGRKVVFVGRSMVKNMGIAADLGYLHIPEDTVIDLKQAHDVQDDKIVYMCTGSQGEPMAALGRIADQIHPTISVGEFDTVILASSLIPGNEHGVYKVINKLTRLGAKVVNKDNAAIHVSGHCDEGELLYFYNIVQPRCAMPIHGEHRHLVANGLIAVKTGVNPRNVILAEDGDVVDLCNGEAAIVGSVPCGYVYVDGDSVGEITEEELEKRRILKEEGFVSSFVVVDTEKRSVISGPKIYLNAMAENESDFDEVRHMVVKHLDDALLQGTSNTFQLQQIMHRTLNNWISRNLRRKPVIVAVVADVAKDVLPH